MIINVETKSNLGRGWGAEARSRVDAFLEQAALNWETLHPGKTPLDVFGRQPGFADDGNGGATFGTWHKVGGAMTFSSISATGSGKAARERAFCLLGA